MKIQPGIYDLLITDAVRRALSGLDAQRFTAREADLEESEAPEYLARHLARHIRSVLRSVSVEDRVKRQVELVNSLLELCSDGVESVAENGLVDAPGRLLKSVYSSAEPPAQPSTPLSRNNLIMNSKDEPRLGWELEQEMQSADQVCMLVSFIQWRGWQRLRPAFEDLARRERPVRILTTTYIGASDFKALQHIARLPNVEMKISLDGRRRRLHAKAWLFQRESGFGSAYVGSANLSGPALEDGIEWTVKLSEVESPQILDRFRGAFESMWEDREFERFHPEDEVFSHRLQQALEAARAVGRASSDAPLFFDLKPHPYQQATLDQLEAERLDRGHFRNLVVAPTGTGKTLIAAFDYQRQIGEAGIRPRLLFLAHREEILKQARRVFRHVLRDESFGELLVGGEQPAVYDYLFATIQSLQSRELMKRLGSDYWHFAVLDEAHHAPAQSYRETIGGLSPGILLGLTATPERMDEESILPWFDNRIADEMRLWNAIECQYLVPFEYYGIYDGVDLRELSWQRGAYAVTELNMAYSGNWRRANLIVHEFCETYGAWREARALGFCVSVEHAEFMAHVFAAAGIPAVSITSKSAAEVRAQAPQMLRRRQVNVLFTVDLFNEGIDIPEVDCLLFLRPTESSTVFVQQLGRGLRLDTGKKNCLVLDFIGNQRREFRFDLRFRALFGGTRAEVKRQIEGGVTRLPGNCYFRLGKEAQRVVLDNLRSRLSARRENLVKEVRTFGQSLRRRPTLSEFITESQAELEDIYRPSVAGWIGLLGDAGLLDFALTELDRQHSKQLQHLLHLDCPSRMNLYERWLRADQAVVSGTVLEERSGLMLTFRLLQSQARRPGTDWATGIGCLMASRGASQEFLELMEVLRGRVRSHSAQVPWRDDWPIYLHRSYTRDEILAAVGFLTLDSRQQNREGRLWLPAVQTELLFVTLEKNERHFSPSTRYEDYAISPSRFHWQSQSTTSEESETGRRYVEQPRNGVTFLLFVRAHKGEPFVFLGPVRYGSHSGSRPMSITWNLASAMPAWFFEVCGSLRVA